MPLALAFAGIVLVIVGVRNTYGDFAATVKEEFTGPANFGFRAMAIVMVGMIGYAGDDWRKLSTALMTLLVLGLLVTKDNDFFGKLGAGVSAAPVKPTAGPTPTASPDVRRTSTEDDPLKRGADILKTALPLIGGLL